MSPLSMPNIRTAASDAFVARQRGRPQNGFILWALLALLALAPLPLGSARPLFWSLWACYAGVVATIFFAWQWRSGTPLRIGPQHVKIPSILLLLTFVALVIQIIPLGTIPIPTTDGVTLQASQLSVAPGQTILMLARQLTYALVAVLVMQVALSERRRPILLHGLITITLVYAAYGLYALRVDDTILGLPKWAYQGSITSSFVNRNSFATYLGFGAILTLAHACALLRRQAARHRDDGLISGLVSKVILYSVAYIFLLLILVGTQSRMGLFAALAGSSLVCVATLVSMRRIRLILVVAPAALAILLGLFWLIGGGLLQRIEGQGFGSEGRALLYQQVLDLIAMRPWTGFGGGTFEVAFPLVHRLPLSPDISWKLAHNSYLALWAELGIAAGSFLILAIAYIGVRLIVGLKRGDGAWTGQIAALGVIVQVAIHSIVDFSLEIPANTLMFVVIVANGLASATRNHAASKLQ